MVVTVKLKKELNVNKDLCTTLALFALCMTDSFLLFGLPQPTSEV